MLSVRRWPSRRTLAALAAALGLGMAGPATASAATDVVLIFDTTGSMEGALGRAKAEIRNVISTVDRRFDGVRYAVAAVEDYAGVYGDPTDLPWELVQPLTDDRALIQRAIDGLEAAGGGDGPESYGRALFEADVDPAIGFRPGAQRLSVLVGDQIPHDDDLNAGVPAADQAVASPYDSGADPGRDEVVGTRDDIDWQALLASLRNRGMPLYFVLFDGADEYLPYWRTWAGITGGAASRADEEALDEALVEAISAGAAGCARRYLRIVNVDVCANALARDGDGRTVATGNVRLDGGVGVGDGPIVIDPAAAQLRSTAPVPLTVVRGGAKTALGTGDLTVDARPVDDPVSGRTGLAPVEFPLDPELLRFGSVGLDPGRRIFLDAAAGGGVVFTARPLVDLLKHGTQGTLAVGYHAEPGFRVLGGKAGWNDLEVKGWRVDAALSYVAPERRWTVEGEFGIPRILEAGLSGAVTGRRIESLGVTAKRPSVPLGSTGILLDSFTGEVEGLAKGPVGLRMQTTGSYGPKIPVIDERPLRLERAEVSLSPGSGGTIKSVISLVDRRLSGGDLDVTVALRPRFRASGALTADIGLLGARWAAAHRMDMDARRFIGAGRAELRVLGRTTAGAAALVSDQGAGVSGRPCGSCGTVGVGIRWRNAVRFPPEPEWIGAAVERFGTSGSGSAAAGARRRVLRVSRGDVLLSITGAEGDVRLSGPDGLVRTVEAPGPRAGAERAEDGRWTLTVFEPRPGRWQAEASGSARAHIVPALGTVVPRALEPRTTRFAGLGQRRAVVGWRTRDLPARARVTVVQARANRRGRHVALGSAPAWRGRATLTPRRLPKGRTRVALVVTRGGVPFRRVVVPGVVWR